MDWLRQCAGWLRQLDGGGYPLAVNLRPSTDWPDRAVVAVDLARVAAVINRIAADVDELAQARRVQDLDTAAVLPDPRAERRRRLAEPDLEFRAFCARRGLPASSTPQLERAWDAWQAERYQRGETGQRPGYTDNPFRPHGLIGIQDPSPESRSTATAPPGSAKRCQANDAPLIAWLRYNWPEARVSRARNDLSVRWCRAALPRARRRRCLRRRPS